MPIEPYIGQHGYRIDRDNVDKYVQQIPISVSREMERLAGMQNGLNYAVDFHLLVKMDFLTSHGRYSTEYWGSLYRRCNESNFNSVNETFGRILKDSRHSAACPGPNNDVKYIDAVKRCHDMIELMDSRCNGWNRRGKSAHSCTRRYIYTALELMFEQAQFEIRQTVLRTVGTCLPRELADLIVDYTIAAEGIPADAKVFDLEQSEESGGIEDERKTLPVLEKYECPVLLDYKMRSR
ncbi:hypothetical protein BDV96DRAFT_687103 [Lophiotrema nucula]|uniref:Uncharacterized protein n=1 Tax=Lophiotrema nucula TaxID=690887 RepID=A0A6A5Z945_9PLEO|nr:hypothetical protein BDV96DRAFT_687103 [Lophiotrema nucula]